MSSESGSDVLAPLLELSVQLDEGYQVAERAKEQLVATVIHLSGAGKWAEREHFFGLRTIADAFKYPKLWRARKELRKAEASLEELSQTIADARITVQASIDIHPFSAAMDIFCSDLLEVIGNIYVLNQIETSLVSVNGALDEVGDLLVRLRAQRENLAKEITAARASS